MKLQKNKKAVILFILLYIAKSEIAATFLELRQKQKNRHLKTA